MRRIENKSVEVPVEMRVCDVCGAVAEPEGMDDDFPPKGWIEIKLTRLNEYGVVDGVVRDVCGAQEPSCFRRAMIALTNGKPL